MTTRKKFGRRDFLHVLGISAGAAATATGPIVEEAVANDESNDEKRKARYQAEFA